MRVGIVNYGMGNLGSVRRALEDLGADAYIADHPAALYEANRFVLPGVGSFAEGMARLRSNGWTDMLSRLVMEEGRPMLGICLGMQLLVSSGEEGGQCAGLGYISGHVARLDKLGCQLRIPHVGWNDLTTSADQPLFSHVPDGSDFYFVHSYAVKVELPEAAIAHTDYDIRIVAAIRSRNVFGTQFHPEKSSKAGRQLLRNFLDYDGC